MGKHRLHAAFQVFVGAALLKDNALRRQHVAYLPEHMLDQHLATGTNTAHVLLVMLVYVGSLPACAFDMLQAGLHIGSLLTCSLATPL
jgi:hypothetical protein